MVRMEGMDCYDNWYSHLYCPEYELRIGGLDMDMEESAEDCLLPTPPLPQLLGREQGKTDQLDHKCTLLGM